MIAFMVVISWLVMVVGWPGLAFLGWQLRELSRLRAALEDDREELARQIGEWECPQLSEELRGELGELVARNAVTSSALRRRGQVAADGLRLGLGGVPDVVLAVIVHYLVRALDGVEGIAARERLDSLDLVRLTLTACAAELSAVELETI